MRCKTAEQADKVLDAAAQLFGLRRFHEVRMEDIAAEAEVGKGTLYRYFADKEELYLGLLDRAVPPIPRADRRGCGESGRPWEKVACPRGGRLCVFRRTAAPRAIDPAGRGYA